MKLEEVADIRSGNGFPIKYQGRTEGEFPFFKVGDISRNWQKGMTTLTNGEHCLTQAEVKAIRAKTLPSGSVVFAKIGAAVALNRRAILGVESLVDNNVMALVPADTTTSQFLFYFMCQVDLGASTRGGAVPSLRRGDVADLEIPLPPLPEQRRIVARIEELFSRLDAGVAALRQAKAQLQRYRQSVLAAAVTGQLTEAWRERSIGVGQSENGMPCGWTVSTVGEAIKIIDYRGRTPPYAESGIPHIRSANIKNGKITWEKMKYVTSETYNQYMTRGIPQQGDLLFTTEAPLGDVTEVPTEKFCLAQRVILLRPDPNELFHKFLKYQIMASDFQGRISGRGTGSTVAGISSRNFKPVPIVIPPLAEQHQIVAEVEARTTAIDHLEAELNRQITRSNRLRQSILASAFAG